jgi:hypothetical protein
VAVASAVNAEQQFVDEAMRAFADNPENRDIALARCLYYLQRLSSVADMLESMMPQLNAMASGPLGKMLGGKKQ